MDACAVDACSVHTYAVCYKFNAMFETAYDLCRQYVDLLQNIVVGLLELCR